MSKSKVIYVDEEGNKKEIDRFCLIPLDLKKWWR